jgi:phosphotransferase system  glucose/maltose/N-acetylglucosamine-specific IIC component
MEGEIPMRKFGLFAAALILAGFAGWIASTTQARVATPVNGARIDALQMMTAAGNLPTEHFVDYSLVYESE